MKNLFSLFVAVTVLFLTGVFANAQSIELFGVATPVVIANRLEQEMETVLYSIDPLTGASTEIGPTNFTRCSSLDFEPSTNELYGVCRRIETGEKPVEEKANLEAKIPGEVLVKFNMETGEGTEVGPLIEDSEKVGQVTDISFRTDGTLFAHIINIIDDKEEKTALGMVSAGYLGEIDTETGKLTLTGPTEYDDEFAGIGISLKDNLYHAADNDTMGALNMLDQTSGKATLLTNLAYPPMFMGNNLISTLEVDPETGDLLAVLYSQDENTKESFQTKEPVAQGFFLIEINPSNGGIIIRGETQDQLAAIAVYSTRVRQVPTLSEYGLIFTVVMLLGVAVVYLRRRQTNSQI